ncbi:hypothetical protein IB244_24630 [Rhizobium sp. RHZ02]|uniref:hypothetical protein n=1 Tax=Rhizobium sp. RHZ02 TaxID=2769306 RepID=UPI001780E2AE|nr:hypothetical protein [Rhizobium sp. RHZ02]
MTTDPNALVKPIHEKAMPVLLLTPEETDIWMRAVGRGDAPGPAAPRPRADRQGLAILRSQRYQGEDRHDESEIR